MRREEGPPPARLPLSGRPAAGAGGAGRRSPGPRAAPPSWAEAGARPHGSGARGSTEGARKADPAPLRQLGRPGRQCPAAPACASCRAGVSKRRQSTSPLTGAGPHSLTDRARTPSGGSVRAGGRGGLHAQYSGQ